MHKPRSSIDDTNKKLASNTHKTLFIAIINMKTRRASIEGPLVYSSMNRSSVQSVLERNRGKLHLLTTGAGCSTKTPSVQIWSRKGQIWEEKAWLDVDATVGTLRVPACASHPVAHKTGKPWALPPVLGNEARSDHDSAAVLQLQSVRTCPESVGTPCDADG
jgi:hypothetical protein